MTDTRRLFIASFLKESEKGQLTKLTDLNKTLVQAHKSDVRFVSPCKWHLTWMFLGNCKKELEPKILEIIKETSLECFAQNIVYDKFSVWPSSKKPRVGVLESLLPPEEFVQSVEQMQKRLSPLLENPGEHHAKLKPHITFVRFKNKCFDQHELDTSMLPLIQKVDHVALVKSDFKAYTIIEKFTLRQE
ncbi:MAG: 2'-5' RNA ligase family protein [Candidatus Melainabacteria bacterium]|nr:2'-5' RNA ligase family protein [Candidatus Melainabacteria bacterium]